MNNIIIVMHNITSLYGLIQINKLHQIHTIHVNTAAKKVDHATQEHFQIKVKPHEKLTL